MSGVSFVWPAMLAGLFLAPILAILYIKLQSRRRRFVATIWQAGSPTKTGRSLQGDAQEQSIVEAAGRLKRWQERIPQILVLAGVSVLLFSLARPQMVVSLPKLQGTIILAFDVSGSMAAEDLQPTRMEAAKVAAKNFVQSQPSSVQIGVVAFSESGMSVQAPTNDQQSILAAIDRLAPTRGTSLANGIFTSLNTIALALDPPETGYYSNRTPAPAPSPTPMPQGQYSSAMIVLLSDGENTTSPDPYEAAQAAAQRGVRVNTVGVGSLEGISLPIEGFLVHTRLDETMLQDIAQITDGQYFLAESEEALAEVYDNLSTQLIIRPEKMEITSLLAGAGIVLLLLGVSLSLAWFGRMP